MKMKKIGKGGGTHKILLCSAASRLLVNINHLTKRQPSMMHQGFSVARDPIL